MRAEVCICRIIFLTGASNKHHKSFPFVLSFSSFCALHRFRQARSALPCYLPLFVPFPMPSFLWALPILSALGGIGWPGSVLLWGGGDICEIWNGEICAEKICPQFLSTIENFGTKFPDCLCTTSIDCEWRFLIPESLWLFAYIAWRILDGCCYFLRACCYSWRPRAQTMAPRKKWLQTSKHRGIIWHTFVVPNFAVPNFACPKSLPLPPSRALSTHAHLMVPGREYAKVQLAFNRF